MYHIFYASCITRPSFPTLVIELEDLVKSRYGSSHLSNNPNNFSPSNISTLSPSPYKQKSSHGGAIPYTPVEYPNQQRGLLSTDRRASEARRARRGSWSSHTTQKKSNTNKKLKYSWENEDEDSVCQKAQCGDVDCAIS